jgi:xanthine/uracil permease
MGSIVALIGLNLVPTTYENNFSQAPLTATLTLVAIILCTALFRGLLGRVSVLVGVVVGYLIALARGEVDFTPVAEAAWLGLPEFHHPTFQLGLLPIFLPVIVVLLAENVGHVTSVGTMTGRNLDHMVGRTLFADGAATALSAGFGGSPTTTYGENIGVMSATRVYSTAAYWVAGLVAIGLSLSPKVGALINTIPPGVLGGVTFVLYGHVDRREGRLLPARQPDDRGRRARHRDRGPALGDRRLRLHRHRARHRRGARDLPLHAPGRAAHRHRRRGPGARPALSPRPRTGDHGEETGRRGW